VGWQDTLGLGPAYRDGMNIWHVTRYADLRSTLRSPAFGPNLRLLQARQKSESHATMLLLSGAPIFIDSPEHTELRRVIVTLLRQHVNHALRQSIERAAENLVAEIHPDTTVDVVAGIANRFPCEVMCHLLGIPAEASSLLSHHITILGKESTEPFPGKSRMQAIEASSHTLIDFLTPLIAARTKKPAADFISALAADPAIDAMGQERLLSLIVFLLTAAQVTTASFIGATIGAIADHQVPMRELKADPAVRQGLLHEVLRITTPLQVLLRRCNQRARVGEIEVPAGASVMLHLGLGNRDPAVFESPESLAPHRGNVLSHISFGAGGRACPGAKLALLEGESIVTALAGRFGMITADADHSSWENYPGLKALARLPVVCHPPVRQGHNHAGSMDGHHY
jgi:cytochrome P450